MFPTTKMTLVSFVSVYLSVSSGKVNSSIRCVHYGKLGYTPPRLRALSGISLLVITPAQEEIHY